MQILFVVVPVEMHAARGPFSMGVPTWAITVIMVIMAIMVYSYR